MNMTTHFRIRRLERYAQALSCKTGLPLALCRLIARMVQS